MDQSPLQPFIDAAKRGGASDRLLVDLLRQQGWPEKEIYAGLGAWLERQAGMPVPVRKSTGEGAKDAFLYLLSFFTLGTWTVALCSIAFTLIETAYPDPLRPFYVANPASNLSSFFAAVIVSLPVYFLAMRFISGDVRQNPEKLDSPIRKWLTYVALLVAAGILIGDLITFVAYLLRGDLTIRFILKVLTVLLLAGGVFWYYLSALRGPVRGMPFALAAVGLAVLAVALGFRQLGSPAAQRQLEADLQRTQDLETLAANLSRVWRASPPSAARLPERLSTANMGGARIADPITRAPYEYRLIEGSHYQLCAIFATTRDSAGAFRPSPFVIHPAGRHCFDLDAAIQPF